MRMDQAQWNASTRTCWAPTRSSYWLGWIVCRLHASTEKRLEPKLALLLALPLLWLLVRPRQFFDHMTALTGWLRYGYLLIVTLLVALRLHQEWRTRTVGQVLSRLATGAMALYLLTLHHEAGGAPCVRWPGFQPVAGFGDSERGAGTSLD